MQALGRLVMFMAGVAVCINPVSAWRLADMSLFTDTHQPAGFGLRKTRKSPKTG